MYTPILPKNKFLKNIRLLSDSLFPTGLKCIGCKCELDYTQINGFCGNCYKNLPFINGKVCIRCGKPLSDGYDNICYNCKNTNYHFEKMTAAFEYKDIIKSLIYKYKYGNAVDLSLYFSEFLARKLASMDCKIDYITFIPLHKNRYKQRGYNQSELLAQRLSSILNIPILDSLCRIKDTPTQTKLSRVERIENIKGAIEKKFLSTLTLYKKNKNYLEIESCDTFETKSSILKSKNILIVDDIYTTGTTMETTTNILLTLGASKIYGISIAHAITNINRY